MIELVFLGSLILLGLHFLTRERPVRPPRPPKRAELPEPEAEFEIVHVDAAGTERRSRIAQVRPERAGGTVLIHCRSEGADLSIENASIRSCRNLRSGRAIKDLAKYCQARAGKR